MAKRKNKITTGEAVKILANETKTIKEELFATQQMSRDFFSLFELFVEWKGDGKEFLKHVKETVEDKNNQEQSVKDIIDEQQTNEQVDGQDTDGDKQNEGIRTEGVRTQEG